MPRGFFSCEGGLIMNAEVIQNRTGIITPKSKGEKYTVRIVKKCPVCGWRILDKVTPTTGIIEMKCPNCRKIVEVNLSYRKIINR